MPASDISRLSIIGAPKSDMAANIAKEVARRTVADRLKSGLINPNDQAAIVREYQSIYSQEYYRYYACLLQQDQQRAPSRIIYVATENPAATKYHARHTPVTFSRQNCFIHVHRECITVGKINYPLDDGDSSPETKESFLSLWPGPLDRLDDQLEGRIAEYIETLWQHDSQRRIRYCNSTNDDHRKTILKLLTELLHRKGTIDAPGVSRLLLRPDQTEIQKDESSRWPLATLQKYLLLGKRSEAIKFAKSKKLWDHAQCLAFLDKYQPPKTGNYIKDTSIRRLKDDPIVQLNDEYINSIGANNEQGVLGAVYRSLLNRIIQSDPESMNIMKLTNVENNAYNFAIMSANDCEIEFDRSNEIFKLIMAIKQAKTNPSLENSHLISLGYSSLDSYDPCDDISNRSHLSFKQGDTPHSRTLTISNIDMLIINEIWEYCLNLPRNSNPSYKYILDLIPYKLLFAAQLLDLGLHNMFASYLSSIKRALEPLRTGQAYVQCDPFYDWNTIIEIVDYLEGIWQIFCPDAEPFDQQMVDPPDMANQQFNNNLFAVESQAPAPMPPNQMISDSFNWPFSPINEHDDLSRGDLSELDRRNSKGPSFKKNAIQANVSHQQQHHHQPPPLPPQQQQHQQQQLQPVGGSSNENMSHQDNGDNVSSMGYNNRSSLPSIDQQPGFPAGLTTQFSQIPPQQQSFYPDAETSDQQMVSPPDMANQQFNNNLYAVESQPPVPMPPNPIISESFNPPFSPINEHDDLSRRDLSDLARRDSRGPSFRNNAIHASGSQQQQQPVGGSLNENTSQQDNGDNVSTMNNNNNNKSSQPAGEQQAGFLSGLTTKFSQILPRSQSKQMILPDDSPDKQNIVFDEEKKCWIDKSKPDGGLDGALTEPPPMMMMKAASPPDYSFNMKSSKMRYAKP